MAPNGFRLQTWFTLIIINLSESKYLVKHLKAPLKFHFLAFSSLFVELVLINDGSIKGSDVKPLSHSFAFVSCCFLLFPELHSVHPAVDLRPPDVDGEPLHLCLRLLQRRNHRQVLQTICSAERAGAGGEGPHKIKPYKCHILHLELLRSRKRPRPCPFTVRVEVFSCNPPHASGQLDLPDCVLTLSLHSAHRNARPKSFPAPVLRALHLFLQLIVPALGWGVLREFLMRGRCHSFQLFMKKFQPDCRLGGEGKEEGRQEIYSMELLLGCITFFK